MRVRAILAEYDLPYTTGPLIRQYWDTVRTICKLSLPDRFLTATSDDAPETASEEEVQGRGDASPGASAHTRPVRDGADWTPRSAVADSASRARLNRRGHTS